jgi:oligopeptide/dipeptide ABC transporter ATP-binding protein
VTTPALSVRGLNVALRRARGRVVEDLDLDLAPGTITGLAGESGSGKTVTALALLGLADAGAFDVTVDRFTLGGDTLDTADRQAFRQIRGRRIAMVFQDPATALDPVFTIGSQLTRALRRLPGIDRDAARDRTERALAAVGFPDPAGIMRRHPHELSGGMRQLCVIAMAQALRPAVLLADEPTTALDAVTQSIVMQQLQQLAETGGTAVLLISHDLRLMVQFAGPVNVMYAGRIVERTTGAGLATAPAHPYSAGLMQAVPRLREPVGGAAEGIPGDAPPPGERHGGCAFAPRCSRADQECHSAVPALRPAGDGRAVACLHPLGPAR